MSWGERSCKKPCRATENCTMNRCNVDCSGYLWDGETDPDSKPKINKNKCNKPIIKKSFTEMYINPLLKSQLRNKLCVCGSGKKVKKCCGKDRIITFAKHEEIKVNYYEKKKSSEKYKGLK